MVEERLVDEKPRRTFLIEREKILNAGQSRRSLMIQRI